MRTSILGRKMIESFEGLSLSAYLDQRGIPTIGFGHTQGVKLGDTCTSSQADEWMAGDLDRAEGAVNHYVRCPLSQNQFDSLVSLTFNIGSGNFLESTVLKRLNMSIPPNWESVAEAFLMWVKVNGVTNPGLVNRRIAEKKLFLTA